MKDISISKKNNPVLATYPSFYKRHLSLIHGSVRIDIYHNIDGRQEPFVSTQIISFFEWSNVTSSDAINFRWTVILLTFLCIVEYWDYSIFVESKECREKAEKEVEKEEINHQEELMEEWFCSRKNKQTFGRQLTLPFFEVMLIIDINDEWTKWCDMLNVQMKVSSCQINF